jgi:hypothetical protein
VAQGKKAPCPHDKVDWEPVEIEYGTDGTAAVWQPGRCLRCKANVQLNYVMSEVTETDQP